MLMAADNEPLQKILSQNKFKSYEQVSLDYSDPSKKMDRPLTKEEANIRWQQYFENPE